MLRGSLHLVPSVTQDKTLLEVSWRRFEKCLMSKQQKLNMVKKFHKGADEVNPLTTLLCIIIDKVIFFVGSMEFNSKLPTTVATKSGTCGYGFTEGLY